jgi:hypothetical protein
MTSEFQNFQRQILSHGRLNEEERREFERKILEAESSGALTEDERAELFTLVRTLAV